MIDVVGVTDAGFADLPQRLQRLVSDAAVVLGGRRQLASLPAAEGQVRRVWPSPLRAELSCLLDELPAGRVVALASGDPTLSGIGSTLIDLFGADAVRLHPAVSSVALARARAGWSAESCEVVTVVGRSLHRVRRRLAPGVRLIVLCSDGTTPAALADLLVDAGCPDAAMTAWWHLDGADEGCRTATAARWGAERTPDLVLCTVALPDDAVLDGPAPGRAEVCFEHDGQITKRDLRASAVGHLRPTPGALLWDLGAGSGSVGIEWCLAGRDARCVSVEQHHDRAERLRRNSVRLGVDDLLEVVEARSADALDELETPDAIFVGGGLTAELLERGWRQLRGGGRFVAHAVTLDTEQILVAAAGRYGGELTRISVEHARPLGHHLSWTPARPVVQWSAGKPKETP